jgi:hypothetical protein
MPIQIPCPFFNRVAYFLAIVLFEFLIFAINHLSDVWLLDIFSHSLGWLFTLLFVSCAVHKIFGLMLLLPLQQKGHS